MFSSFFSDKFAFKQSFSLHINKRYLSIAVKFLPLAFTFGVILLSYCLSSAGNSPQPAYDSVHLIMSWEYIN